MRRFVAERILRHLGYCWPWLSVWMNPPPGDPEPWYAPFTRRYYRESDCAKDCDPWCYCGKFTAEKENADA